MRFLRVSARPVRVRLRAVWVGKTKHLPASNFRLQTRRIGFYVGEYSCAGLDLEETRRR